MVEFLNLELARAGADSMITPREMLRDYMTVLNILMQNEKVTFEQIMSRDDITEKVDSGEENQADQETAVANKTFSTEDIEF